MYMNIVEEKWADIIEYLRTEHELSNVSFTTWIQPLKVYDVIKDTVYIMVNMNASVEYIEKNIFFHLKYVSLRLQELNMTLYLYQKMIKN